MHDFSHVLKSPDLVTPVMHSDTDKDYTVGLAVREAVLRLKETGLGHEEKMFRYRLAGKAARSGMQILSAAEKEFIRNACNEYLMIWLYGQVVDWLDGVTEFPVSDVDPNQLQLQVA